MLYHLLIDGKLLTTVHSSRVHYRQVHNLLKCVARAVPF